ncbi:hypothetical protein DYB28_004467, partial [Aphanomyces astaci]
LSHSTQLLESLVTTALTPEGGKSPASYLAPPCGRRTAAIRCLLGLLEKAAQDQVVGPPTSPYQSFGSTVVNLVPNQLHVAKSFVFGRVQAHLPEILTYLQKQFTSQQQQQHAAGCDHGVRHTAYTVSHPFTEFRLLLVQMLVALVEHDAAHLATFFSVDVWRILVAWFVQYPHTNLYHHAFYRLVFLALRTNDPIVLKPLLQHAKLVTTLIDVYRKDPTASSRGYILQACNAIRLQAATLPPDAFLRSFLQSHATWRSFESELCATTQASVVKGLGIPYEAPETSSGEKKKKKKKSAKKKATSSHPPSNASVIVREISADEDDDVDQPPHSPDQSNNGNADSLSPEGKKKKRKKHKK